MHFYAVYDIYVVMTEIRIVKVPEELKRSLKMKAVAEGRSMNEVLIDIITTAVSKQKKRGKPS